MTANTTVVNTNEFFCVPVGKSRQAAIFLGNLVKNAVEEGKRIPKRMEMSSDLGMCVKWIEDIGVPAIYAYSAYYSAKGRGVMKGEGQSMMVNEQGWTMSRRGHTMGRVSKSPRPMTR